jgi:hypothetical protein
MAYWGDLPFSYGYLRENKEYKCGNSAPDKFFNLKDLNIPDKEKLKEKKK